MTDIRGYVHTVVFFIDARWQYTEEVKHPILAGSDASPTRFDPASVMHYEISVSSHIQLTYRQSALLAWSS